MGSVLIFSIATSLMKMNSTPTTANLNISSSPTQAENSGQKAPAAADVPPATVVITIKGLCAGPGPHSANTACETTITRAEFEKLADIVYAEKGAQIKRQFATSYPQILVMAHEAENRGLDKQPRFQERLRFARAQILSQELIRQLREESARVPETNIADYYREHSKDFEQVSLERIVVPASGQGANKTEDEMSKEAELLRSRATQGEDFTKLQREAYEFAGVNGDSEPNPNLSKMRRRGLPLTHAAAFDLKPGEVSSVISDATGHYIYKLDAREIAPLESVKPEIIGVLRQERMQNLVQAVQQPFTTEINQTYFRASEDED
jgi:hypothetical protein